MSEEKAFIIIFDMEKTGLSHDQIFAFFDSSKFFSSVWSPSKGAFIAVGLEIFDELVPALVKFVDNKTTDFFVVPIEKEKFWGFLPQEKWDEFDAKIGRSEDIFNAQTH